MHDLRTVSHCINFLAALSVSHHCLAGSRAKQNQPVLQLALKDLNVTFCDSEAARSLKGNLAAMKISVLRFGMYYLNGATTLWCA
jgi:hypothetical protein